MQPSQIQCIGFIMDGNRRWAHENNVPALAGHSRGREVMSDCVRWVRDAGIPHAVFYAFSTENWLRKKTEVDGLLQLFTQVLQELLAEVDEDKVRIRIVGRRADFAPELQSLMSAVEKKSESYSKTTIWIALSYGGRAEIIEAVNMAVAKGEPVTEDSFAALLQTAHMPDPDLIVRTGGEQRLSNFATWKSVYSELVFIDTHWPALTKSDFKDILTTYESRERRKGV